MLKPLKNILEKRKQLDVSSEPDDWPLLGDLQFLQIERDIGANGMKPVYGPWIFLCCAIDMRGRCRNHQQLVFGNFMPASSNFAPTSSARAIDKNRFRTSPFSRAFVTLSSRIKSSVTGK